MRLDDIIHSFAEFQIDWYDQTRSMEVNLLLGMNSEYLQDFTGWNAIKLSRLKWKFETFATDGNQAIEIRFH